MTEHHTHRPGPTPDTGPAHRKRHGGHSWMMIACCIPMIAIAVALVAAGVVDPGFLLVAVVCTAMMALMMGAMGHDDGADGSTHGGHGSTRR